MNATDPLTLTVPGVRPSGAIQAFKHLDAAEQRQAQELARGLDVGDSLAITAFGVKPQADMSALTDPILKLMATKDTGAAGKALSDLSVQVKALDAGSLANLTESFLARLPGGLGRSFTRVQQFRARA